MVWRAGTMRVKWIIGGLIVAVGIFIGGFVWHNNIKRGWVDGSSVSLRYAMELEYRLEDHVNKVKFIPGSVAWTTDSYVALDRSEEHTSELQSRENIVCR